MWHLHLTHASLAFWINLGVHGRDEHSMPTADLGEDSRDVGVGDTPPHAVRTALRSMGEPHASEMAEGGVPKD